MILLGRGTSKGKVCHTNLTSKKNKHAEAQLEY